MAKIIENKHGAFVNEAEHEANLAEANAGLDLCLNLKRKSKPKPPLKERILLLAPIKQTSQYTFYVCHELVMKGKDVQMVLIAPAESGKEEALRVGMYYNSVKSNLPPYVFRVHYTDHKRRLTNQLANTLSYLGPSFKGHYKVLSVNGWTSVPSDVIFLHI